MEPLCESATFWRMSRTRALKLNQAATHLSLAVRVLGDVVGGAGEDIERSLRSFAHSGSIVRLNFAAAVAKNTSNAGGLQHYYRNSENRLAAHGYVVRSLCEEFPSLLRIAPGSPNGVTFTRRSRTREEEQEETTGSGGDTESCDDVEEPVSPLRTASSERREENRCDLCGTSYARKEDMLYHVRRVHENCAETVACPLCSRAFRKKNDMLLHYRMQRCHSKRGRRSSPRLTLARPPSLLSRAQAE